MYDERFCIFRRRLVAAGQDQQPEFGNGFLVGRTEDAVVASFLEAGWQHMLQEQLHELHCLHGASLDFASFAVFIMKGNGFAVIGFDAIIADEAAPKSTYFKPASLLKAFSDR